MSNAKKELTITVEGEGADGRTYQNTMYIPRSDLDNPIKADWWAARAREFVGMAIPKVLAGDK